MELTVLVDNSTQKDYDLRAEFGLSILLEDEFHKVIFDCGYSDVFIKNAYHMGIELADVTDIVLSHSHNDHTGGFLWLQNLYKKLLKVGFVINNKRLIVHPYIFQPHLDENFENIGFPGDESSIGDFFEIAYTKAVSYTHLDVYKRQSSGRAIAIRRIFCSRDKIEEDESQ